ncbi:MAG: hypothetical protein ABMA02_08725 [Saprospiraceae bacterium]
MRPPFQKTLYRHENNTWHYTRLVWQEVAQSFEMRTAPCGQAATSIGQEVLLSGEKKETALHRLAVALRHAGYWEQPTIAWHLDIQVFTPVWDGFTAAAPWFDALQFDILFPLYAFLEDTANGGNSGGIRTEPACLTYFLWTANPVTAKEAIESIARQAPAMFQVVSNIRKRGEKPAPRKPLEPAEGASGEMEVAFGLENKMIMFAENLLYNRSLPENQQIPDKTYPDNVFGFIERQAPDRVRGEKAGQLRNHLLAQWGVGKDHWPPLGGPPPCKTLYVEGLDDEAAAQLITVIQQRITGQVYVFDTGKGIFVSEPAHISFRPMADDTYWFDDGQEWLVYVSHENTVTFGGDWLLKEVREIFKELPERLNPWSGI